MPPEEKSEGGAGYYQFEEVNLPVMELLTKARQSMPAGQSVLDLGCGRGRLAMEMEKLGYRVTGIEANPVATSVARGRMGELIEIDLAQFKHISEALAGRRFDWIVASDVMEHLPYPEETLNFYKQFLKPGGKLIVSVPNIALWDIRLRLLFGQFNYVDSGVLDRTHMRFFTVRTAKDLLKNTGFRVTAMAYDPGIVRALLPIIKRIMGKGGNADPGAIVDSAAYRAYTRFCLPVERAICNLLPGLFTFRIVMQGEQGA
jgi:2-polyprenyl-3-methyl-5-hydroxy-6-metoxy-1,4-benzoquinol methylase